jgi:allantoicase
MRPAFLDLVDLASWRLGASVIAANDEFFAPKENLIRNDAPRWREGAYTERGKWMDGWETRRRREPGDDWCIVRLAVAGIVRGVDVETTHFKGNYPEACSIDACDAAGRVSLDELSTASWNQIVPRTPLSGDAHNFLTVERLSRATHLRLRIFPDGGVARLRAYGDVAPDWARLRRRGEIDLAATEHGGLIVACSDMFFGSARNLLFPGDAINMGDGWETKRRRGPGHDWVVIRLGSRGIVSRIEVDTRHFRGNAPGTCSLDACSLAEETPAALAAAGWQQLLPAVALQADVRHVFDDALRLTGTVSHVRFNIFPDGGVGRLRLFGRPE